MRIIDNTVNSVIDDLKQKGLSQEELKKIKEKLKNTKVNVLLVGGTGVGKSSTIKALLDSDKTNNLDANTPKIGSGQDPETQYISKYEYNNLVVWDSPGLGDSTENDDHYKAMLSEKMKETLPDGSALIDLVILVLDARIKDYKSSYELIRDVIKPNLGNEAESRLLIGINQIDGICNGMLWDKENHCPTSELTAILDEKTESVQRRIFEDSGLNVDSIYYSAGFTYKHTTQKPYNLAKLLDAIMTKLPEKKRAFVLNDINNDEANFEVNDGKQDYTTAIKIKAEKGLLASLNEAVESLAKEAGEKASEVLRELINSPEFKQILKDGAMTGLKMIWSFIKNKK